MIVALLQSAGPETGTYSSLGRSFLSSSSLMKFPLIEATVVCPIIDLVIIPEDAPSAVPESCPTEQLASISSDTPEGYSDGLSSIPDFVQDTSITGIIQANIFTDFFIFLSIIMSV